MMRIYCRTNVYQMHDFFLKYHGTTYYLFTQKFRRGVDNYYSNGVLLDKAIDHSLGKSDCAVHRTMEKLRMFIRYVEKENDIIVLKKTRRKKQAA